MRPCHTGNAIVKYADDTYRYPIIPVAYYHTRDDEVSNVKAWAATNNLQLNCSKSREIVFRSHQIRGRSEHSAPPCVDIEHVDKLTILGVLVNNSLTATNRVSTVLASCASLMYALRVLRSHVLSEQSLKDVFQATVVGKLLYCTPAWSGFCSAAGTRLNSFLHHCDKLGYIPLHEPDQTLSETRVYDQVSNKVRWGPLGFPTSLRTLSGRRHVSSISACTDFVRESGPVADKVRGSV